MEANDLGVMKLHTYVVAKRLIAHGKKKDPIPSGCQFETFIPKSIKI